MAAKARKKRDTARPPMGAIERTWAPLAGWTWQAEGLRGRLHATEEAEIARTPRPIKSPTTIKNEHEKRAALIDAAAPPDVVPTVIVRVVNGTPEYHPAFLRYLTGERGFSDEDKRVATLLEDLQQKQPVAYAFLTARWLDGRSDRAIADQLGCDHKTVGAVLARIEASILHAYQSLFTPPIP